MRTRYYLANQIVGFSGFNSLNILNFKTVQDGATQVGPTSMVKFLSNSTTSRERINITSYISVLQSSVYYNFWVQNPTSGAAATLQPESTAA